MSVKFLFLRNLVFKNQITTSVNRLICHPYEPHLIITDHANRNGIDFRRYQFPTSGIINRSRHYPLHGIAPEYVVYYA